MLRLLVFVIAVTCVGFGYAQSENPERPRGAKKAAKDERGTEKQPLFIHGKLALERSKVEADEERKRREEDRATTISIDKALGGIRKDGFWTAVFTGILAVVTALLAYYTFGLWSAGEENAKRQLRAYVGIVGQEIHDSTDNRPIAYIDYANKGQTPAHDVRLWVNECVFPKDVTDETVCFLPASDEGKGGVMVPGAQWRRHCPIALTNLPGGHLKLPHPWPGQTPPGGQDNRYC
jgi:hypothetical protein